MMSPEKGTSLDEIRDAAARICRDYLTGKWKEVDAQNLVIKRISGGLSNFLYYVSLPEDKISNDDNLGPNDSDSLCTWEEDNDNGTQKDEIITDFACTDVRQLSSDHTSSKRQRIDSNESEIAAESIKYLQQQQNEPHEVLLRIYGQTHGEDALESIITESVVFALLSERNFGPKLHGIFPGGRIEQYIPARPLKTAELANPKISVKIAEKMGEIHSLNIPMSKEPDWLWKSMNRWLNRAASLLNQTDCNDNHYLDVVKSFDFQKEIQWLKDTINLGDNLVLFCHNDMQEGNILLHQTDVEYHQVESICDKANDDYTMAIDGIVPNSTAKNSEIDLMIIDFEYCAYNYRGFDLANHFLEWTFDYTNPEFPYFYHRKHQYPSQMQRRQFICTYLKKLNDWPKDYIPDQNEINNIENEVVIFTMASHLFWSLWSVVNATSKIEFGYWNYAVTRIQEYKSLKTDYIAGQSQAPSDRSSYLK